MAAAPEAAIGWLVGRSALIGSLKFKGKWSVVWRVARLAGLVLVLGRVRSWQVRSRHDTGAKTRPGIRMTDQPTSGAGARARAGARVN